MSSHMHVLFYESMSMARYSILLAILLNGILHVSILKGSFDSESFCEFINVLLMQINPFPGPNSVIIMDNYRIHKSLFILDMIEQNYDHFHPSPTNLYPKK